MRDLLRANFSLLFYLGPSGEAKSHLLLQDECQNLLDWHWHYTLPEVIYLTPPLLTILFVQFLGIRNHLADTFDMPKRAWIIV